MKSVVVTLVAFLMLSGVALANEQQSTIVGPVMQNRYVAPNPQDKDVKPPETVQKLMDQKVIPAAEAARLQGKQTVSAPKTN